jgi:hypothetical protein
VEQLMKAQLAGVEKRSRPGELTSASKKRLSKRGPRAFVYFPFSNDDDDDDGGV